MVFCLSLPQTLPGFAVVLKRTIHIPSVNAGPYSGESKVGLIFKESCLSVSTCCGLLITKHHDHIYVVNPKESPRY